VKVPAVAVLIAAGFQVPLMPFWEVAGRAGGASPWQSGPMGAKLGAVGLLTVMFRVVPVPQEPGLGVNV
jgi:hypothetical protein